MGLSCRIVVVIGLAVLFAGVGPAGTVWAAPSRAPLAGPVRTAPGPRDATSAPVANGPMPDMPGMNGATGMAGMSGMSGGMPGMSTGSMPMTSPTTASADPSTAMPGMDDASTPGMAGTAVEATPVSRPRVLVIGGFGILNTAVLVAAAVLRRRTPAERSRRTARRTAPVPGAPA